MESLEYDDGTRKTEIPTRILSILQYMGTLKHASNVHGCPRQQDATPPRHDSPDTNAPTPVSIVYPPCRIAAYTCTDGIRVGFDDLSLACTLLCVPSCCWDRH